MAAYGALVSVMHIIEQLQHHPHPPITLDKLQTQSLSESIAFLQDFLEVYNFHYSNQETKRLRSCIADAAYAAGDVIESHIVNQIHDQSPFFHGENVSLRYFFEEAPGGLQISPTADASTYSTTLYRDLEKVINTMDSIKKEVVGIKEMLGTQHDQQQRIITSPVVSSKSPSIEQNMVDFGDILIEMLDKLTSQSNYQRQIIPIYGMGGIGKTTLAKSVYTNPLIEHHFHVRIWLTISQEYNIKEIFMEVLLLCVEDRDRKWLMSQICTEAELGEILYKYLYGRRYLIVIDDVWSNDVWEKVKFYFPNNINGSRIVMTTRLSNVASDHTSCSLQMSFLDQDKSWSLFCKTVFGKEDCPQELEEIGKKIVENLKGLPLSIVVLGGVLAKSKQTREYWEYVLQNLNAIVNLEENERCLKILQSSYFQLPIHLKVCFLYMGTFPEDSKIRVSELINTWVAEGFLKPISGESLEESAMKYLMDLIDRNLILVSGRGKSGNIKLCGIHDLLRDLCLREAQKEEFLYVSNQHSLNTPYECLYTQRCVAIHENASGEKYLHSLKLGSVVRSLAKYFQKDIPLYEPRLLRVLRIIGEGAYKDGNVKYTFEDISQLVNLRCLIYDRATSFIIFPSVCLFWNLQTLVVYDSLSGIVVPPEIWKMPLLRHVKSRKLVLPDPPSSHIDSVDDFALQNLQSLSGIYNLKLSEEVLKRINNVKKLKLRYSREKEVRSNYSLKNLCCLDKLESFYFHIFASSYISPNDVQNLTFPHSLKKLSLECNGLYWEDISTKIGSLPLLQVLKLETAACGYRWETIEGKFCSLKYLEISCGYDLEYWIIESTHFPCLERLVLAGFNKLMEIPMDIGEIPTLKSIELRFCSDLSVISAKRIIEEQEELGNEGLQVTVLLARDENDEGLRSLASQNFQVK